MLKKVLSVTLAIAMLFTVCSVGFSASAADFAGYTAVSTKEDLYNIRNNTSGKYYLTNDIVFDSTDANWKPIESFSGILDGNGYSIKGLKIKSEAFADELSLGMINKMYGKVCNLTMDSGEVEYFTDKYSTTAEEAYLYIGTIAGTCYGEIVNCHNTGEVVATAEYQDSMVNAGGIVGRIYEGTVKNCTNSGSVYTSYMSGGIAGYAHISDVDSCSNSGSIYSDYKYAYAGGIVCFIDSSVISNCYNTGEVTAYFPPEDNDLLFGYDFTNIVGGITAYMIDTKEYNRDSAIRNCYNRGTIVGTCYVGGIMGFSSFGYIENCYNSGMILADHTAGGVAGYTYGTKVSDCFNAAFVTTYTDYGDYAKAGGICGIADYGELKNCYNVGPVTASVATSGDIEVGGVVGLLSENPLENCYYYSMFNDKGIGNNRAKANEIANMIELATKETYKGFDFDNVWKVDYSTGYAFPMLRNLPCEDLGLDWQLGMTEEKSVGVSVKHTGKCGDNLTWTIYSTNVLYITGTGDMYDYSKSNPAPWSKYPFEKVAAVTNGVTSVGDYAFYNCDKLATVYLGYDVERIGDSAFENCDNLVTAVINEKVNYIGKNAFADCPNYIGTEFIGHIVQFFAIPAEDGNSCVFNVRGTQSGNTKTIDLINDVSKTSLNYGDVLWLTVDESKIPEGCTVSWFTANAFFTLYAEDGDNIAIQNVSKGGKDTVYAMIVDEDYVAVRDENGELMVDCVEIQTSYNFFMLIIHWIRSLFGIVRTYT